jgi:hypothetical protein
MQPQQSVVTLLHSPNITTQNRNNEATNEKSGNGNTTKDNKIPWISKQF